LNPPLRALLWAACALAAGPLRAQGPADVCAGAIPIVEGIAVSGTTAGATSGPDPVACNATNDVWYSIVLACGAQYVATTCNAGTTFDTVVSVWNGTGGCAGLALVACNDNNCAVAGQAFASRVTFTANAGGLYYVSVGGKGTTTGPFTLRVDLVPVMTLAFFDLGPGTLGYHVTGPPLGTYFTAVSLTAGAFPFGWFYGIDLPLSDIVALYNAGPPFVGLLSVCGQATVGPFGGLPSGLTAYAVALGFAAGAPLPGYASNPATATVP
jgi:hypothetical protein